MKRIFLLLSLALILAAIGPTLLEAGPRLRPYSTPFACTSFALYTGETLYGMNFDYPDVETRFILKTSGELKVFEMEFQEEGGWSSTVGMNSAGLFASCQMLFPEGEFEANPADLELYPWQVFRTSLESFRTVAEIREFLNTRRIVHWQVGLHDLFADTGGDAMVVEAGDRANAITPIDGDFIVMTNFPNRDFVDKSYKEVSGTGSDRYIAAYEHIQDNLSSFDVEHGLEALEKALASGSFPTQCSMVFDPQRGEVYIVLKGNFDQIWKASLDEGTIETYSGFARAQTIELGSSGILASDLQQMDTSGIPLWTYPTGLVVLLAGGICFLVSRKRATR
jgi:hypothetical protein